VSRTARAKPHRPRQRIFVSAQGAQATVFTSDTDDMNQLLAGHSVQVEKV
jgi:hypothetical protein